MQGLEKVIVDAERHLEFAEKHAVGLDRRLQEVTRACARAEKDVQETTAAISVSEKKLSELASQQSDTRKKLSALYRSLIALPNAPPGQNEEGNDSSEINTSIRSNQLASHIAANRIFMCNSLTISSGLTSLLRHARFGLLEARSSHEYGSDTQALELEENVGKHYIKKIIDTVKPLCTYALVGCCTDKNCCFQHLDEDISFINKPNEKQSSSSRSWRGLKLHKFFKHNVGAFKAGMKHCVDCIDIVSNVRISKDTMKFNDGHVEITHNDHSKNRYFTSKNEESDMKVMEGPCNAPPLAKIDSDEYMQIIDGESSSSESHIRVKESRFDVFMSYCYNLWSCCEVDVVCNIFYKCLGIESDKFPFHNRDSSNSSLTSLPDYVNIFVVEAKEHWEECVLLAVLVHMLTTNEFIGCHVLKLSNDDFGSDNRCIDHYIIESSSWRHHLTEKISHIKHHAPKFFTSILLLLQHAHDCMATNFRLQGELNDFIPVIKCSDQNIVVKDMYANKRRSHDSNTLALSLLWFSTSLITELQVKFETKNIVHDANDFITSFTGSAFEREREPLLCPQYSPDSNSFPVENDTIDLQLVSQTLRLRSLSKSTIKNISSELSSTQQSKVIISDCLALGFLTCNYLYKHVRFEEFAPRILGSYEFFPPHNDATHNAELVQCPGVVFVHGDHTWMLTISSITNDENFMYLSSKDDECASCRIYLLSSMSHICSDTESARTYYSGNETTGTDTNSDSEESQSSSVDEAYLYIQLQEVFNDIFSISILAENRQMNCGQEKSCFSQKSDVNKVIFIWLCIGQICSFFDTDVTTNDMRTLQQISCRALKMHRSHLSQCSLSPKDVILNPFGVDDVGAAVLLLLSAYGFEFINKITHQVNIRVESESDVEKRIMCFLSYFISALISVEYSVFEVFELKMMPKTSFSNIFQAMLHSILKELHCKKLLSLRLIDHIFYFIGQGANGKQFSFGGNQLDDGRTEQLLHDYYSIYPLPSPSAMKPIFSQLLTGDVLDLCLEVLNGGKNVTTPQWYFAHSNDSSIERFCLKISQSLCPNCFQNSFYNMNPATLFHLALIYFVAENFEGVLAIQKILLEMKNPFSLCHFCRVFCVCFENESLSFIADVISAIMFERKTTSSNAILNHNDSDSRKKRRVIQSDFSWISYLVEEKLLLDGYSCDTLVSLSYQLNTARFLNSSSTSQIFTVDLSNFTDGGVIPAGLTEFAEKTISVMSNLRLCHNSISRFPLVILDFDGLTHLDLSWNSLSSLPSDIDKLKLLQILNVSHNCFVYFPTSVLKLKASLLELYIQDNKIEVLRNDFLKLSHLEVLDVSNNRLKSIPSYINSHMKLKFFRFSGNPVHEDFDSKDNKQDVGAQGWLRFSSTRSIFPKQKRRFHRKLKRRTRKAKSMIYIQPK